MHQMMEIDDLIVNKSPYMCMYFGKSQEYTKFDVII